MKKVTAYLSHSIRGHKGETATREDMDENCKEAIEFASWLRKEMPELDIFVPAEHEEFVGLAYVWGYLTEKQILCIDCMIVGSKDLLIVFAKNGWTGGGIEVEVKYADKQGINTFYFSGIGDSKSLELLRSAVGSMLSVHSLDPEDYIIK